MHRVELFDQWPDQVDLAGVVGVMNRSATEHTLSPMWPAVSEVLAGGDAPTTLAAEVVDVLDAWVADDAPRLDADDDGDYDSAGPLIMDAIFEPLADAVLRPVFGDLAGDVRGLSEASIIDKDLRTILGHDVEGPFNLSYCGGGDLDACRTSMWAAVDTVAAELSAERGDDPNTWLDEGRRRSFTPGLIPDTFRITNRPTFQQVLEFAPQ